MRIPRTWWLLLLCAAAVWIPAPPLAADGDDDGEERVLDGMAHLSRTGPNLLYEIDPESGEATLIGSTGTSVLRISVIEVSDDGMLYAVGSRNDAAGTTMDFPPGRASSTHRSRPTSWSRRPGSAASTPSAASPR